MLTRPSSNIGACLLLLLLLLTATALASGKKTNKNDDEVMSFSRFIKMVMGHHEYEITEPTPMLVIGAGVGRTGTTSYMSALERLGLQSYHMKGVLGTPGHVDMWLEYMMEKRRGDGKVSKEQVNKLVNGLAAAGFDATASMPACLAFQDLMEHYPNARVVVTVRGDGNGQAWATSVLNSVGGMLPAMKRIPFCWIPKLQQFSKLLVMLWDELGCPVNATTSLPERNDLARAYDDWLEHVQSVVVGPNNSTDNNRLLLFAAQSGWQPLCDFLSPVHPKIETACQEILESGESYPRANDSANVQSLLKIFGAVSWMFEHVLHFFAGVGIVLLLVARVKQSIRRAAAVVNNNKKKE